MADSVIKVENLSKKYVIRHQQERYKTLRDTASNFGNTIRKKLKSINSINVKEDFWALKDISFEIKQGEVVGIIGRNGAGKSTLLKVLSRITEPTAGKVKLRGRVASLLEVGTGFHPELTGRENIYLNGAILGMHKIEIKKKFDEIVDFAEIETFLDTPVKYYSSGMYVRLAFSVAAHLEPEILIVDEVLAVGDAMFQKKCLGRMGDVAEKEGRTVLFVSHNMKVISTLCPRTLVLDNGLISQDSNSQKAIMSYMDSLHKVTVSANTINLKDRLNRSSGDVRFTKIFLQSGEGEEKWNFQVSEPIYIKVFYKILREIPSLGIYCAIRDALGENIVTNFRHILSNNPVSNLDQMFEATIKVTEPFLRQGTYSLYLWLGDAEFSKPFDIVDENINLPYLLITSDAIDPYQQLGYFSIGSQLI